ncbi:MAG: FAD-dependent oxidoreductase [Acidimicrobiia bacterium]|nr:FAD-dependent oxidoreductase [Acidimicrobiia bacterium]NNC75326.1 FAD-dependent oxidoreductase [Acidimicrobiia bacterium]
MSDPLRIAVVGGGPAGHSAATIAATLGAEVTLIEDSIVGGAAHLWDCIPSKAMVASSMRIAAIRNAARLGISDAGHVDLDMARLGEHLGGITDSLASGITSMLVSQGVEIVRGRGRFTSPNTVVATTDEGDVEVEFDAAVVSTGSRPWEPDWAAVDGDRVITTRHAYHLHELPEHIVVVGSGVTGVEMVHIFSSLGSKVTLLVSRHHVLPHRDAEVATVLEEDFLERGVVLLKGSRANGAVLENGSVVVTTEDGRRVEASHALLAVGSVPNTEGLDLELAGVETERGYVPVDEFQRTSAGHIYAAGDVTGQLPLSSVATAQGRLIANHVMGRTARPIEYAKVTQAIFTEPEIASVGLEEVDAAAAGRKVRITKVPFAANPRALIQGNPRGFVKVISDPATREVLGGTVVGHHASELIAPISLAVAGDLQVDLLLHAMMAHPSLVESISEAAE